MLLYSLLSFVFFFFNDTATTEIYTLSLHDALPISRRSTGCSTVRPLRSPPIAWADRKSTRLNSSHLVISYAVFCLKKKKQKQNECNPVENPQSLRRAKPKKAKK